MPHEINVKIRHAREALKQFDHDPVDVSAEEFYDYMTGEIFSDDPRMNMRSSQSKNWRSVKSFQQLL